MRKPVLLVVDMLNDYLADWEPVRREAMVAAVNELTGLFRAHGCAVIWVRQEFEADLSDAFPEMRAKGIAKTIRGTSGCELWSGLVAKATDTTVIKKRYSAFFRTRLDEVLAEVRPDEIVLAGINTHACIRMAAIDAYQRDWPVVLAAECIDSYDREHHEVSLRYMKDKIARVLANREIRLELEGA